MKELRRHIRFVGLCLVGMFGLWLLYFCYSTYFYGGRWFANPYNTRISSKKQSVIAGTITDAAGEVLAYTDAQGERRYAQDEATRRAVSHVVGDDGAKVANGVETFHAQYLLGFNSNVLERLADVIRGQQQRGDDIQLTISAELSRTIAAAFPEGRLGAVVVLNYRTGDVLAMVSKGDFDPENMDEALANEEAGALVNRATQGLYPPGSVFKIVTLASALSAMPGVEERAFLCTGQLAVDRSVVTDAGDAVHGEQTLVQAFSNSCNNVFASLALDLGYQTLGLTAQTMGFNDNFLFRDLVVYNSSYPIDDKSLDDLAWSGVGQGRVLVTPLHMAMIAGAVANDGQMMEPRLLKAVVTPQGQTRSRLQGSAVYAEAMTPQVAQIIADYMVTTVQGGTARQAAISGYRVGGKTGSAEASDDKTIDTHAWFTGFVQDDEHPLAVAVVVEFGGSGGSVAAPLAKLALEKAISLGL